MFAIQTDDLRRGFTVTRGVSFYLVVVCVILTIKLAVLSLYEDRTTRAEPFVYYQPRQQQRASGLRGK